MKKMGNKRKTNNKHKRKKGKEDMYIRRAKREDIDGINKLLYQVLMVHHNGRPDIFKANAKKYTNEEIVEIIEDDNTPIFVCVNEDEEVLGYAFCIIKQELNNNILTDIKSLYIDDLCVDEDKRGMHIGKNIYDYVVSYAKEIGCYNLTLNVWSCNSSAMKFYEKCGLVPQKVTLEKLLQ